MLDTLSNVKSRLGITTSDDDTFLTNQITLVSDVIEAYCRRSFSQANWIQTFYKDDLKNINELTLYHYPVSAVTDLTVDNEVLDVNTDIRVHKPTGIVRRIDFSKFYGDVIVVEYTAGYSSIPTPILSVLDAIVGERYNKKKSGVDLNFGSDVQRLSIPGAISIDFNYSLANNERKSAFGVILGNHANVLDNYRSERAVVGSGTLQYVEAGP